MTLKRPCEHGRYERHFFWPYRGSTEQESCPGGVVLDPEEAERRIAEVLDAWAPDLNDYAVEKFTTEILDALAAAQTGETA